MARPTHLNGLTAQPTMISVVCTFLTGSLLRVVDKMSGLICIQTVWHWWYSWKTFPEKLILKNKLLKANCWLKTDAGQQTEYHQTIKQFGSRSGWYFVSSGSKLFAFSADNKSSHYLSKCMRFPTMWYVRPVKPQISLRIRAVWSEPLLVAWVFYEC